MGWGVGGRVDRGWVSVFYKNLHWLGRNSCLLGLVSGRGWARLSAHSTPDLNFRKEVAGALSEMGTLPWVPILGCSQRDLMSMLVT